MVVLDASALLALLFQESGQERVAEALAAACMSTVNLSEVLTRFARLGKDPNGIANQLAATPVEWVALTQQQAALAATFEPATRRAGLSLGDRVCLVLAFERGCPALTADRGWRGLDLPVAIEFVR